MSRIIKKAARQLVAAHKLIQYREKEVCMCLSSRDICGWALIISLILISQRKKNRNGKHDDSKRCRREENPQQSQLAGDEEKVGGVGKMPPPSSSSAQAGGATVTLKELGGGTLAAAAAGAKMDAATGVAEGAEQEYDTEEILDALLPSVNCGETYPIDCEYDKKVSSWRFKSFDTFILLSHASCLSPCDVVMTTGGRTSRCIE